VRAVLEGIAQRGADLVESAVAETGEPLTHLRVDGGMSANRFLVQALADATGCVVEVSAEAEATTREPASWLSSGPERLEHDQLAHLRQPQLAVEPRTTDAERRSPP
jgi:glycerol kinase